MTSETVKAHLLSGKGRLELPPGDFCLSGDFSTEIELELVGAGCWQTRLICQNLTWRSLAHLRLRNLHLFDGTLEISGSADLEDCWVSDGKTSLRLLAGQLELKRCRLERNLVAALEILGGIAKVENCHFERPGRSGVQIHQGQLAVSDCTFEDGMGAALRLEGGQTALRQCQFEGCRVAIRSLGQAQGTVERCLILGSEVAVRLTDQSRLELQDNRMAGMEHGLIALDEASAKIGYSSFTNCSESAVAAGAEARLELMDCSVARCCQAVVLEEKARASLEHCSVHFSALALQLSEETQIKVKRLCCVGNDECLRAEGRSQVWAEEWLCQDSSTALKLRQNAQVHLESSWLIGSKENDLQVDSGQLSLHGCELTGRQKGSWSGQHNKQGFWKNLFQSPRILPRLVPFEGGSRLPLESKLLLEKGEYFGLQSFVLPVVPAEEQESLESRLLQEPWKLAQELSHRVEVSRESRYLGYALRALERASSQMQKPQDRAELCRCWGRALLRNDQQAEGLDRLWEACQLEPADSLNWETWAPFSEHDPQASERFQRALELHPESVALNFWMANMLYQRDDTQASLAFYERALARQPQHLEALVNRGVALLELNKGEPAIASLRAALAVDPSHKSAQGQLARAYLKLAGRLPDSD